MASRALGFPPSSSSSLSSSSKGHKDGRRPGSPPLDPRLPTNGSAVKVKWSRHDGRCTLPQATAAYFPVTPPSSSMNRTLDKLPVEIINHVLSYLVHPRSRLAGRTESLSSYNHPPDLKRAAREAYNSDRTRAPDTDRWAVDLFSWGAVHHPFNDLALTSRAFRDLVENFCLHLVKANNRFNLPFELADRNGWVKAVHPDLSGIVFRRLWLQYAPRRCIYCNILLSSYPHDSLFGLMISCLDCFYDQVYTLGEVEAQFHLSWMDLSRAGVRATPRFYTWILRCDVEALALSLYGTRAFHNTRGATGSICEICREAGTLARIMRLRAEHEGMEMQDVLKSHEDRQSGHTDEEAEDDEGYPGSNGWIVRRDYDTDADADSDTEHSAGAKWIKLLQYHSDPYNYREEDNVSWGYHLSSERLS